MIQEFIKTFFKMPRGRWTKYRPRPEQPYQWSVGYTCKGYDGKHGVVAWEVPEETADALLALKGLYDRYAEEHGAKCQGCGGSGLMPSRIIDAPVLMCQACDGMGYTYDSPQEPCCVAYAADEASHSFECPKGPSSPAEVGQAKELVA